jgi:hypothetical protein
LFSLTPPSVFHKKWVGYVQALSKTEGIFNASDGKNDYRLNFKSDESIFALRN